ncbi:MAG: L-seryl-tRNA(Sec) selenium transferase [bacterium]|jgi:L-seryl-tRNA(Ser) seleniumtransferase
MTKSDKFNRRDIPSIEALASEPEVVSICEKIPRQLAVVIIRETVEEFKRRLDSDEKDLSLSKLKSEIVKVLSATVKKKVGRVINGTGILVHTNLGRAPLAETLFDRIKSHIVGYGNLEFDINSGKRGRRGELAEKYLALMSESEDAVIVNNNAAAIFLIINTLACKKKVVIARGELVQIGGGFRIPDIIKRAEGKLLEVGTTNITTIDDYRAALAENPAMILRVHKSNFTQKGFTEEPSLKELTQLGAESGVPVINDLGSGVFIDTSEFTGTEEPTVQSSSRDGSSLTCFSGDKLLGGVQSGLIVGQRQLTDRLKKNPVYRALRVDKIVFSALEELLKYYLDGVWQEKVKLWSLAAVKEKELYERGQRILKELGGGEKIILEGSKGEMGGGSLPTVSLPSVALVFRSGLSPQKLAQLFRTAEPPVIGRIADGNFLIDLKAIDDNDLKALTRIIKTILPQL